MTEQRTRDAGMTDAIPAATLILFRPGEAGADQHLMIERAAAMAFAGGALVFPGGRIDPADHALAAALGGDDPALRAARIAAIRETIEETGVAPAIDPEPAPHTVLHWRRALAVGAPLAALLGAHRLCLERLVPFARWRPNFKEARTFDTRFFIAEAPAASAPLADGAESVHAFWADAAAVLADGAAGRHRLIFPTLRMLERLAALGSFAAARGDAALRPDRTITPVIEQREGEPWLCIPDDMGYPVTAQRLDAVRRA